MDNRLFFFLKDSSGTVSVEEPAPGEEANLLAGVESLEKHTGDTVKFLQRLPSYHPDPPKEKPQ